MIEIELDGACLRRLRRELQLAGPREIGGVLAGEDLGDGVFRVVGLSVQRAGGGVAHFVRDSATHRRFMRRFFSRTGHAYSRFNYLGEWHSHPSFPALPSGTDIQQMQSLIEAPDQSASFLILLVAKLARAGAVEASAHAFRRARPPLRVVLADSPESALRLAEASSRVTPRAVAALRQESTTLQERAGR